MKQNKVSIFGSAFSIEPKETKTLEEVLLEIKSPKYKDKIESLRKNLANGDDESYAKQKKSLSAFCVSGVCTTRASGKTLQEKFSSHSGYIQVDLDRKDNPSLEDMDGVREKMRRDSHVAAYFVSPSGCGLKAVVRIRPSLDSHLASWEAVAKRFRELYGLEVDKSTKDPLRLCFMSYDPDLWIRAEPAEELQPLIREIPQVLCQKGEHIFTESDIEEMLSYISPRPDYEDWLRISSAVWSVLPCDVGTTLLKKWSPEEKPGEYEAKWKNRLERITVGTLVYYARQGGYDARRGGHICFGKQSTESELPESLTPNLVRQLFKESNLGMAKIFCTKRRGAVLYDHKIRLWRRYNRGVWERDETGKTRLDFADVCKNELLSLVKSEQEAIRTEPLPEDAKDNRIKYIESIRRVIERVNRKDFIEDSLSMAGSLLPVDATDFDADPYLVACENGTLDLKHGRFREHSPEDKITIRLPVSFDENAICPYWEEFVNSVFGENEDTIRYVQRAVGYSLSGLTNEDALFFLIGAGANGKTIFRNTLEMLFGDYRSEISISALLTATAESNADYQKARLKGARIVFTDEVPENKRFNESQIKAITGRDTILARNPYEKPYSFTPTHKLWLIGNHKPTITGTDNGIWRRINIIPFKVIFTKEKQISPRTFYERFRGELPGILNWALRGWYEYRDNGLKPPAEVIEATNEYRSEQDQIGAFVGEALTPAADSRIATKRLYGIYSDWTRACGEFPVCKTANKLTMKLKELGYSIVSGSARKSYLSGYVEASGGAE